MEDIVNSSSFVGDFESNQSDYNSTRSYCGTSDYELFWARILPDHRLLIVNLCLCFFGVVVNCLNMYTFTRSTMRSPINTILLGISMFDFVLMLTYIPDGIARQKYFHQNYPLMEIITYVIHYNILRVFHASSVMTTVVLSIFRYIAVLYPLKSRSFCTVRRARLVVTLIFMSNILICMPGYFFLTVITNENPESLPPPSWNRKSFMGLCNSKYCAIPTPIYYTPFGSFMWAVGGLYLFLPCVILTFTTLSLIRSLTRSAEFRSSFSTNVKMATIKYPQNNFNPHFPPSTDTSKGLERRNTESKPLENSEKRITKMLVTVLLLFLSTEGPLGIICIIMTIFPIGCIEPLSLLTLTLMQISGAFNFIIYLVMSENFRSALCTLNPKNKRSSQKSSSGTEKSVKSNISRGSSGTTTVRRF